MREYQLKDVRKVVLRKAIESDAVGLLKHLNQAGKETNFLGFGAEGIDMNEAQEREYIQSFTPKNFMLVALVDDEIIGSCSISCQESRIRFAHRGELGICIQEKVWRLGIGEQLMRYALALSQEAGLRKIFLDTRSDNKKAISLYKKLGFEVEGTLKKATLIDGIYYDNYVMGKEI